MQIRDGLRESPWIWNPTKFNADDTEEEEGNFLPSFHQACRAPSMTARVCALNL